MSLMMFAVAGMPIASGSIFSGMMFLRMFVAGVHSQLPFPFRKKG